MKNVKANGPGSILARATSAARHTTQAAEERRHTTRETRSRRRYRGRFDSAFAGTFMQLVIDQPTFKSLIAQAESDGNSECCGLLVGVHSGDDAIARRAVPAKNIAEGDHRRNYQIDWETLLRAQREARDSRQSVVGFYHSHPNGSCRPSRSDLLSAWSDRWYVILAVKDGQCTKASASIDGEDSIIVDRRMMDRGDPVVFSIDRARRRPTGRSPVAATVDIGDCESRSGA